MKSSTFPKFVISVLAIFPAQFVAAQSPASVPLKVDVLSSSPVVTDTALQVICLFRSSPKNKLSGALSLTDNALKGLLTQVRGEEKFGGILGETLLITPPAGALKARQLLLVGLGDSETFSPERMRLVGRIVMREADRLGIAHPYFAPTVKDGGVSRFTTGEISEQVILGALDAYRLDRYLQQQGAGSQPRVTGITYLAGKEFAASTQDGVNKALAEQPR